MKNLRLLLLVILLAVVNGQTTSVQSSCLMVNGETVCYELFDTATGVSYNNNLCSTPSNPQGSLATAENEDVLNIFTTMAGLMEDSESMWIAGEKLVDDIYFRTENGRILPINDWPDDTTFTLEDNVCACIQKDGTWDAVPCDTFTARYYVCQDKTDSCPVQDRCDHQTPYSRNLDEWCFWPYDLRFIDDDYLYIGGSAWFHCRHQGGYVMSMHNTEDRGKLVDVINSFDVQGIPAIYDELWGLHLSMQGYNYRWRNGHAAVGLKNLGMSSTADVYFDRTQGFQRTLLMETDASSIFFESGEQALFICEAKRMDLCLFHVHKPPKATIIPSLTHLLYECEEGHHFADGNRTKIINCDCDFDALVTATMDLACQPNTFCENQVLALGEKCQCDDGFTWDESGLECEDIDECQQSNGGCDQTCVNNDGSYECQCSTGYEPDPDTTHDCMDEDECLDPNSCPDNSHCVNVPGSFDCLCLHGFSWNDATSMCDDIDECTEMPGACGPNGTCINHDGFYVCECNQGYSLANNGQCEDVDECSWERKPCSHICTNREGGFDCSCPTGYELDADFGTTCIDIDECKENNGGCLVNQLCENTGGSFQCTCHAGYHMVNDQCSDINECSENPNACGDSERCSNVMGSYMCFCEQGQLRKTNGECIYSYSTNNIVIIFRLDGDFIPEYEDSDSPESQALSLAVEQQFFMMAKQLVVESSFVVELSPGSIVVRATLGIPFSLDPDLTRDVLVAVNRAVAANNQMLYLQGQALPVAGQISYRTPQTTGVWDSSDVCSIYNAMDYCLNGGTCVAQGNRASCSCQEGYSGDRCDREETAAPSVWNPVNITLVGTTVVIFLILFIYCCLGPKGQYGVNTPYVGGPPGIPPQRFSPWSPFRARSRPVPRPPNARMPFPLRFMGGRVNRAYQM